MADRFYCPGPWPDGRAVLEGDEARHLARVRRVGVGESVAFFDGRGARGHRPRSSRSGATGSTWPSSRTGCRGGTLRGGLILATAVPKGDRFDWLVEKATELGVTRLVPIRAERSSVDPRPAKLDRLRRLVVEACKQSGRSRLMEIAETVAWADWLGVGHPRARAAA